MNYPSQLRGWAFDRTGQRMNRVTDPITLEQAMLDAETLAAWSYIPDKDWEDTGQHVLEMADDIKLEKLEALITHLSMIYEKRDHAATADKVQESLATEAAQ